MSRELLETGGGIKKRLNLSVMSPFDSKRRHLYDFRFSDLLNNYVMIVLPISLSEMRTKTRDFEIKNSKIISRENLTPIVG